LDLLLPLEGKPGDVDLVVVELTQQFGKEAAMTAGSMPPPATPASSSTPISRTRRS
jgi:hypothetical protein